MRTWLCGLLLGMLGWTTVLAGEPLPDRIRLVSEVWENHTNADGTGLAWELLREVFEPEGVKLEYRSMPYTRSTGLVLRGEADAWVGSYLNEVEGAFYPRWHYDADRICALGLKDKPAPTLETIGDYRLVWLRGYEYQQYLPNLKQYQEIQRSGSILAMLAYGHADYYLDAQTEIEELLEQAEDKDAYRVTRLTLLPLYLGFTDSPRGRQLAALFDQRMAELVRSGRLRPMFERWKQPYPFD